MKPAVNEKLATHIMPTAATMVGVCLTAIGLVKLVERQSGPSMIDEFLAVDSVMFCMSVVLSYGALRWAGRRRSPRYEKIADALFTVGMVSMVGICVLFAFDLV